MLVKAVDSCQCLISTFVYPVILQSKRSTDVGAKVVPEPLMSPFSPVGIKVHSRFFFLVEAHKGVKEKVVIEFDMKHPLLLIFLLSGN